MEPLRPSKDETKTNMSKLLFKNATVVLPDETSQTNVLVEGSRIASIDPAIHTSVDEVIDGTGLHLIPGLIDDQVHFREPGLTHKEDFVHATRACAKGGVTTFLEMPNTIPNVITDELLQEKLELASTRCLVNYGFYIGATPGNVNELKKATRTPGIKIFIGSSTGDLLVDQQEALERIFAESTLPICAHCEDEMTVQANLKRFSDSDDVATHSKVRDHMAALISTRRSIDLAKRHNHRFHVLHVSTAGEIELIRDAKGIVTAEVCPHHLFFNTEDYARLGSLVKMNPSIKNLDDNQQLWSALLDSSIQVVATDHAPHTLEEKKQPYPDCPSGLPAVENSLALMLNQVSLGLCTIEQVVSWMCTNPARVWDIVNKGEIREGYDADLALVDLSLKQTVLNERQETKSKWSPWHGETLQGWAVGTWVMGQRVFSMDSELSCQFSSQALGREAEYDHSRGGFWG